MDIILKRKPSSDATLLLGDIKLFEGPNRILAELQQKSQPINTLGLMETSYIGKLSENQNDPFAALREAGRFAQSTSTKKIALAVPKKWTANQLLLCLTGLAQGAYRFDNYQKNKQNKVSEIELIGIRKQQRHAVDKAKIIISSLTFGRDLINTPAMDLGPDLFVEKIKVFAKGSGLNIRVLKNKTCSSMGMGCLTAVGAASHRPPIMLVLEWSGSNPRSHASFQAICGKGICFDTGGLNLKSDKSMLLMRKDMGGAATVAAAMIAIAKLNGEQPVRAYLPLADNALGPEAFRPGDILKALNGSTIEIGHTDAEGRLVLADAISLAKMEGATAITSIATLTGAALIALGRIHVPVMGDKHETDALIDSSMRCGEKAWRLPLEQEHRNIVKGTFADLNNAGNGEAGCITAAAFLEHFAGGLPFAHCDISPTSWKTSDHDLGQEGATGVWISTLIDRYT